MTDTEKFYERYSIPEFYLLLISKTASSAASYELLRNTQGDEARSILTTGLDDAQALLDVLKSKIKDRS